MLLSRSKTKEKGTLLNGVVSCHIIVNEFNHSNPKVIMLIGEIHGKQSCGESDYITAYQSFLHYNEVTSKIPIDMFIEASNYNMIIEYTYEEDTQWIYGLRKTFQDCYVPSSRDDGNCFFKHTRFHWTDPSVVLTTTHKWLYDIYDLLPFISDDNWTTNPDYAHIANEIKSEDDLQKIIFENPYIIKEGSRCTISDWRTFISEQYNIIYSQHKSTFEEIIRDTYWWRCGMFITQRFSVDVYAFLRMFRRKDSQNPKWTESKRFENIIYHAGNFHVDNIKQMILSLNTANAKFRIESETHSTDSSECCRVDFMKFLKKCKKRTSRSRSRGPGPSPPVFSPHEGTFIRRQKQTQVSKKGGSNRTVRRRRLKRRSWHNI
jgi:hypothetical protein